MSFSDWVGPMFMMAAAATAVTSVSQCTKAEIETTSSEELVARVVTRRAANSDCLYLGTSDPKLIHTIACNGTMKVLPRDDDSNTSFIEEHPNCFEITTDTGQDRTTALCNYTPKLVHAFRDQSGKVHSRIVRN